MVTTEYASPSSLVKRTAQTAIEELVDYVAKVQQTLGTPHRLHLFVEQDLGINHSDDRFFHNVETRVLFSPTVSFGPSHRRAAEQIVNALSSFVSPRLSTHAATSSPPIISTAPVVNHQSFPPSRETPQPSHSTFPYVTPPPHNVVTPQAYTPVVPLWFPGLPREEPDRVLTIRPDLVFKFSGFSREDIFAMYRAFFMRLYERIKKSAHAPKIMRNSSWKGTFSYADFTAPWLFKLLGVAGNNLYLNRTDVVVLPHARTLRNSLGVLRASRILASFYQHEPECIPLLETLFFTYNRKRVRDAHEEIMTTNKVPRVVAPTAINPAPAFPIASAAAIQKPPSQVTALTPVPMKRVTTTRAIETIPLNATMTTTALSSSPSPALQMMAPHTQQPQSYLGRCNVAAGLPLSVASRTRAQRAAAANAAVNVDSAVSTPLPGTAPMTVAVVPALASQPTPLAATTLNDTAVTAVAATAATAVTATANVRQTYGTMATLQTCAASLQQPQQQTKLQPPPPRPPQMIVTATANAAAVDATTPATTTTVMSVAPRTTVTGPMRPTSAAAQRTQVHTQMQPPKAIMSRRHAAAGLPHLPTDYVQIAAGRALVTAGLADATVSSAFATASAPPHQAEAVATGTAVAAAETAALLDVSGVSQAVTQKQLSQTAVQVTTPAQAQTRQLGIETSGVAVPSAMTASASRRGEAARGDEGSRDPLSQSIVTLDPQSGDAINAINGTRIRAGNEDMMKASQTGKAGGAD